MSLPLGKHNLNDNYMQLRTQCLEFFKLLDLFEAGFPNEFAAIKEFIEPLKEKINSVTDSNELHEQYKNLLLMYTKLQLKK